MGRLRDLEERLAAWADRRILPALLGILLVSDLSFAANWTLSPERVLRSPAYSTAKMLLPMHVWGSILALLSVAATTAVLVHGQKWMTGYLVGPCMVAFWGFWSVLFAMSYGQPGASMFGAITSVLLALLHGLAGLSVIRAPTPSRRATDGR